MSFVSQMEEVMRPSALARTVLSAVLSWGALGAAAQAAPFSVSGLGTLRLGAEPLPGIDAGATGVEVTGVAQADREIAPGGSSNFLAFSLSFSLVDPLLTFPTDRAEAVQPLALEFLAGGGVHSADFQIRYIYTVDYDRFGVQSNPSYRAFIEAVSAPQQVRTADGLFSVSWRGADPGLSQAANVYEGDGAIIATATYLSAVPAPGALALMLGGIGALGALAGARRPERADAA
ncbi:hypothetical protein ACQ5SO_20095 [Rhodovulum sp. DZ06]|uniref:hypothetical protein n=1 Tax=Rhodovulum sp. DZ06 TaxID=3425126 RepID=UPI003D346DCD